MKRQYDNYLIPQANTNKTFYSFGGKSTIIQARKQNEVVAPELLPT